MVSDQKSDEANPRASWQKPTYTEMHVLLDHSDIRTLYENASSFSNLARALKRFESYTGASTIVLHTWNPNTMAPIGEGVASSSGEADQEYREHYFRQDPRVSRILGMGTATIHHKDIWTEQEIKRSPVYNEFLKQNRAEDGVMMSHEITPNKLAVFGSFRETEAGRYSPDEMSLSQEVFRHLMSAIQLKQVFLKDSFSAMSPEVLLNAEGSGVIFLTYTGKVVAMNDMASGILADSTGLSIMNGFLRSSGKQDQHQLSAMLTSVATEHFAASTTRTILLSDEQGRKRFALKSIPLDLEMHQFAGEDDAVCAVFISDLLNLNEPNPDVIRTVYNVTPAEARFLSKFGSGKSLQDISDELEVSMGTIRWTCKKVMQKLGVNSQVQLTNLMRSVEL